MASLQTLKTKFLAEFGKGTVPMNVAARTIGVDQATVWRWRQTDPAFDASVTSAQAESDKVRVVMVEDSLFGRIVAGKASPAETIFFLVNRSHGRWRHIQTVQHAGAAPDGALVVRIIREDPAVARD